MYMKVIFTVINTTKVVLKTEKKKIDLGLYRIWTHDLCDHGVVLYRLSQQASQKLVIVLVHNKPVRWWVNNCKYMKIIHVNCLSSVHYWDYQ